MVADNRQVVVTGIGPVTSIGVGVEAMWSALLAGRSNVVTRKLPVGVGEFVDLPVAGMPPSADVPGLNAHMRGLEEQGCCGYRDLAYTLLAAELACSDAGLVYDRANNNIGAVQVFEAPGTERTVGRLFELFNAPVAADGPPPVYDLLAPAFYNSQAFSYVQLVGRALGLHGFSTSVHNACSSAAFAIEIAAQRIRTGQADVMLVLGGEAFDTAVRVEWFRRLGLYALDHQMRPFDDESSGFYVGEGAGALVLESAEHAAKRGTTPYAMYSGGAFAHQAAKDTTPDLSAARLSGVIREALGRGGLRGHDLDLIVPHGASTAISDGYEVACLAEALKGTREHAVATVFKAHLGHLLGASGVVETICALLSMRHGCVPATLRTRPEHVKLAVPLVTHNSDRPVGSVLKLSVGFTGHDAAILFRKV